ncbi:hypothetical protein EV363DRAFT_1403571 [Boletus edulis]|uniref:Uncharacterized protein n=1 Tax=Boletus edulis BED1 TaxID=1328754 RepID=A0AAD4GD09_BOLED|nr:hypothetical protein EV363DRAFT_1403571 [Boletus edulis]KAF8436198.1 hypothetical protein L210DRAFT_3647977 [Boletus edulis BED1]
MSQGRRWCMATDVTLPSLQSSSNRIVFRWFLGRPQHTIELRTIHVLHEQRSSPGWTPSPTTPINSYPSSLASLSPSLGPYASGILPESHFESDIQMMGVSMDTDSMRSEPMGWDEVKDSPWDMKLFLDLDVVC